MNDFWFDLLLVFLFGVLFTLMYECIKWGVTGLIQ